MKTPLVIGHAKRDLKEGEVITIRIRPDGLCESDDIKIRKGLSILDVAEIKPQEKKENGNGTGQSCSIWK
jgi:hypothetical protein